MSHRESGPEEKGPRLIPPVYMLFSLIAMALLHWLLPVVQLLEFPARWAGAALMVASAALVLTVVGMFRKVDTPIPPGEKATTLVTGGPFRFSRNPIYVGLTGFLLGVAILMGSLTPLLVVPVFVLIIHYEFVLYEERMLESTFGTSYAAYRSRVRRWI